MIVAEEQHEVSKAAGIRCVLLPILHTFSTLVSLFLIVPGPGLHLPLATACLLLRTAIASPTGRQAAAAMNPCTASSLFESFRG